MAYAVGILSKRFQTELTRLTLSTQRDMSGEGQRRSQLEGSDQDDCLVTHWALGGTRTRLVTRDATRLSHTYTLRMFRIHAQQQATQRQLIRVVSLWFMLGHVEH